MAANRVTDIESKISGYQYGEGRDKAQDRFRDIKSTNC